MKGQREEEAGLGAEMTGGRGSPLFSTPTGPRVRALLTWHREEGELRRDQIPHGKHRHVESIKPEDKVFYLLTVLGQV